MKNIYLIEKIWIDDLENHNAYGYDVVGFVETEKEAKEIVDQGGRTKKGDCWQINIRIEAGMIKEFPTKYKYTEVKKYKEKE
jgi:hypothetical protein